MWLLTVLVILAISSFFKVFASHEKIIRRCIDENNGKSTETYNVGTQECCGGTVYSKRKGFQCCGSSMYKSSTGECCHGSGEWILHTETELKQCCNNRVYDVQDGMSCCGKPWTTQTWMNTRTHTCCPNGVRAREGQGHCCGLDKVYQPGSQMCCENDAYDYESRVHDVGHNQADELHCCGLDLVYRKSTHQCCIYGNNFTIQPQSEFIQCCGMTHYDIRTQVCCRDVPQPLSGGKTKCCGETSYNTAMETCCAEELFPIGHGSCCHKHAYSRTTASCCRPKNSYHVGMKLNTIIPEIPGVQQCCSTTSYLINHHVCCGGQLHDRTPGKLCCGSELYDTQSQLCCFGNTILPKHTNSTQCCLDGSFESNSQTCCYGQVANITNGMCCYTQPYDPKTTSCCEEYDAGQTYPGADQKNKCCGTKLFNRDTQICTNGQHRGAVVYDKPANHLDHNKVCFDQTYNSKTGACGSDGSIYPIQQGEQICGGLLYHPDDKICCQGVRYQRFLEGEERLCCGWSNQYFTPSTQTCFSNKVFDIPQHQASFCRSTAYNNQTHFCYDNLVVRRREDSHLLLCGYNQWSPSAWYDPDQFKCHQDTGTILASDETLCNGVVFDTPGVGLGHGGCCQGAIAYNPATQFCCGLQVHNISEETECCGSEIYNKLNPTEICCRNRLRSTTGGRTMCTGDIAHRPDQAVCGGSSVYNTLTHMCCSRTVHTKHDNSECCGKLSYNTLDETKLCCEDTLHSNASDKECCGNQLTDPTTRTCREIAGQAVSLPTQLAQSTFCMSGSYDPTQDTCCNGILHSTQGVCCGSDLITDSSLHICCGETIHMKDASQICCGGNLYRSSGYTCCGNKPLLQSSQTQACCNDSLYDIYEQKCNNGTILSLTEETPARTTELSSTVASTEQYYPTTMGLLTDGTPASTTELVTTSASTVQHYPTTNELMCEDVLYDNRTSGCCSGLVYNIFNRRCDDGKVVRNKCEVCQLRNRSRRQNLKQACRGQLILLVRITAKEVDNTKSLITLTAEDVVIVKDLLEPSQDGVNVIK
ncbi:uncharacterized protein [Amphiura filiformis]|uniref:uncharacterized protein n=1 Tax=Amphiura filiformis TaxID=82378 RepID=UPI003B21B154